MYGYDQEDTQPSLRRQRTWLYPFTICWQLESGYENKVDQAEALTWDVEGRALFMQLCWRSGQQSWWTCYSCWADCFCLFPKLDLLVFTFMWNLPDIIPIHSLSSYLAKVDGLLYLQLSTHMVYHLLSLNSCSVHLVSCLGCMKKWKVKKC
jgi:hypothetical protein